MLLSLAFLFFISVKAQDFIVLKDGKKYPATPSWEFACNDYVYGGSLIVQLARTPTGGILKVQVNVSNNQFFIADQLMIFLEDGKTIFCADKGLRENQDGKAISYYYLTAKEMELIRRSTLKNIRFKIIGKQTPFSNKTGYFTASNKPDFVKISDKPATLIDTKIAINSLYQGL